MAVAAAAAAAVAAEQVRRVLLAEALASTSSVLYALQHTACTATPCNAL